ncbi:MAG TPA: hypothetical protein PK909_03340 [Sphaerochaeta sp.]|nr:hypothetical protein [Sphaerochaeta sp.]HQB54486.1 hypothetical protein [Sphaerochaeta sp.]
MNQKRGRAIDCGIGAFAVLVDGVSGLPFLLDLVIASHVAHGLKKHDRRMGGGLQLLQFHQRFEKRDGRGFLLHLDHRREPLFQVVYLPLFYRALIR